MSDSPTTRSLLDEFYRLATDEGGEFELALTTAKLYVSWVRQFLKYAKKEPEAITREDVENYVLHCRRIYAGTTLPIKVSTLRSFFQTLVDAGLITMNPFEGVRLRRARRGRRLAVRPPVFIPHEDILMLLDVLEEAPDDDIDRKNPEEGAFKRIMIQVLIRLLYNTGLRINEATLLTLKDINRERREVYVRGKGGREEFARITKLVPFWGYYDRYLRAYQLRLGGRELSDKRSLFPYQKRWLQELVIRLGRMAGLEGKVSPHAYRHSFCTELARRGIRAEVLQPLARHRMISTTMVYIHMVRPYVEEQLKEMGLI